MNVTNFLLRKRQKRRTETWVLGRAGAPKIEEICSQWVELIMYMRFPRYSHTGGRNFCSKHKSYIWLSIFFPSLPSPIQSQKPYKETQSSSYVHISDFWCLVLRISTIFALLLNFVSSAQYEPQGHMELHHLVGRKVSQRKISSKSELICVYACAFMHM